jgi:hypothetical protein
MRIVNRFLAFVALIAPLTTAASVSVAQGPTLRVTSSPRAVFRVSESETEFTTLNIQGVPADATLYITCVGGGCPFRSQTATSPRAQAEMSLTSMLGRARFRPGTIIEVRITAPNSVGKVLRWTVQRNKAPKLTSLCLQPGATKPSAC